MKNAKKSRLYANETTIFVFLVLTHWRLSSPDFEWYRWHPSLKPSNHRYPLRDYPNKSPCLMEFQVSLSIPHQSKCLKNVTKNEFGFHFLKRLWITRLFYTHDEFWNWGSTDNLIGYFDIITETKQESK